MPSIDLGLPRYVVDNWVEFGFTEAKRRATVQQLAADSVDASNYYGAVMAALNAIGAETVPVVPAFGGAPTSRYLYGTIRVVLTARGTISSSMSERSAIFVITARGTISNSMSNRSTVLALRADGAISRLMHERRTVLALTAVGVIT